MAEAVVKEIAYKADVAALATTGTPEAIGTTAALGNGGTAARDNHVHILGAGVVDGTTMKNTAGVLSTLGVPAAATEPAQMKQGQMYMDSDDGKLYACTVGYTA